MVGSGARPGDDVEHSLADSLHLVFINPAKHRATLVGIPRDSYVPIPNHGTGKINSSLFYGGPALLVDTIENMSGVTVDYWAITTFWGFEDMIDGVGGLTMDVPFAMSDSYARADFQPGVQELSGKDALAFARTRHDLNAGRLRAGRRTADGCSWPHSRSSRRSTRPIPAGCSCGWARACATSTPRRRCRR